MRPAGQGNNTAVTTPVTSPDSHEASTGENNNDVHHTADTSTPSARSDPSSTPTSRTPSNNRSALNIKTGYEISAHVPRSTLRAGEDSGTIAMSITGDTPVAWLVTSEQGSPLNLVTPFKFVTYGMSTTFRVVADPLPIRAGTYSITITANHPHMRDAPIIKTLSFTVLAAEPHDVRVAGSRFVDKSWGTSSKFMCIALEVYNIPKGSEIQRLNAWAELIRGDSSGIEIQTIRPNSTTPEVCLLIDPNVMKPGPRTFRFTTHLNDHYRSVEFTDTL